MKRLGFLALALVLVSVPITLDAQVKKKSGKSVTQLRKHLNSIKNQKKNIQKQLRATKHAVVAVKGDIQEVDTRLTKVANDLANTTDRLDKGKIEQKKLTTDLGEATSIFEKTKEQVRKRLRWMYVHGQTSFVSVLMGTRSVGDLATRQFLMARIAKKDREVFDAYKQQREDIARKKHRQDQLVVEIRDLADTQHKQHTALEGVRAEKGEVLKSLRQKQGELQRMLAQFEADEAQIASQIQAFMRTSSGKSQGPAPKGRFGRPCNGRMTSSFGMRYHPILHINRLHAGVDFGAPIGAAIFSANDGTVIAAQKMRGYGNVVIIDHGGGISTVYGHCSAILVSRGQHVRRGQQVARVGMTGLATGPHLHFEVRVNGKPVNPMRYL